MIIYRGGTAFCIAAQHLGVLVDVGDHYTPGRAEVAGRDSEAFEQLLTEDGIPFYRVTQKGDHHAEG